MMKFILTPWLLYAVISSPASGVRIESDSILDDGAMITTELNKTVSLTCVTDEAAGREKELVWLRNGALVHLAAGTNRGRSSVCVSPVSRDDDDATFTCQLKEDAASNASVTLNVTYAPVFSADKAMTVEEQDTLVLQCDMRANPPVSVSWLYQGALLDLSKGGFRVTNDGVLTQLTVDGVDRALHQGKYRCVTTSYTSSSQTFHVTVNDRALKFPVMPLVAGAVVVCCTSLLAIISRRQRIAQCCK